MIISFSTFSDTNNAWTSSSSSNDFVRSGCLADSEHCENNCLVKCRASVSSCGSRLRFRCRVNESDDSISNSDFIESATYSLGEIGDSVPI